MGRLRNTAAAIRAMAGPHYDSHAVLTQVSILRARMGRLRNTAAAIRAMAGPHYDSHAVLTQIALRAVREMSLPDSCADLLINDNDNDNNDREREWDSPNERRRWDDAPPDCCRRSSGGGSSRCLSAASIREHHDTDNCRASTCRREPQPRADVSLHSRQSASSSMSVGLGPPLGAGPVPLAPGVALPPGAGPSSGRLSSCVPDVAMAPNANTHLLAAPYCRPTAEYSSGVLQLDLGDGATHTPRPGSRAARALAAGRERRDFRDLAAVYSSFQPRTNSPGSSGSNPGNLGSNSANLGSNSGNMGSNLGNMGSGSSNMGSGSGSMGSGGVVGRCRTLPPPCRDLPPSTHRPHHGTRSRSGAGASHVQHAPLPGRGSSPGFRRHALLQPHEDYRVLMDCFMKRGEFCANVRSLSRLTSECPFQ
ncbi:hypothetical protein evm_013126 [Chilo suppressalis]|nr:hypothetical protein evm_013126 [Chilo suppressalis]